MNINYHDKYLKYKSKYMNLVLDIENLQNQEGGAQRYSNQYMITLKLNITEPFFLSNIDDRYNKIKELIVEVKPQKPHFTLLQIIINAEHPNVVKHVNDFLTHPKNQGKNPQNAINWLFGNLTAEINKINNNDFKLLYTQGISTYELYENDTKYFYCKKFKINDEQTKKTINKIINDAVQILQKKFTLAENSAENLIERKITIYKKPSKMYLIGSSEVFYYNIFYENQSTLHITIAKILKNIWEQKYQSFNITDIKHGDYFLNVCNKIITTAGFNKLFNKNHITMKYLTFNIETHQNILS